jgi:hypothetical protein
MKQIIDWKKLLVPGLGPIRGERQHILLRIEVCAFDRFGRFFTEATETADISESGCKFTLRTEIPRDSVIAIRVVNDRNRGMQPAHSILFGAVRIEKTSGGWVVGASKLQHDDEWMPYVVPRNGRRNPIFK